MARKARYRLLVDENGKFKAQKRVWASFTETYGVVEVREGITYYEEVWVDMEVDLSDCKNSQRAAAKMTRIIRGIPKGHDRIAKFDEDGYSL